MKAIIFGLVALVLGGCYQAHSDDDLRTVPVTNNPHVITDKSRDSNKPGVGF